MTNEEIKKIAEDHWSYVKNVIKIHEEAGRLNNVEQQMKEGMLRLCEFHYITAFVHGWKHGMEREGAEETFTALITKDKLDSLLGYR